MHIEDVASPIELKKMNDAQEWEKNAMQRPFRLDFFEAFYKQLSILNRCNLNILELGSGPGFLAEYLLSKLPELNISLLDNSCAMHELAKKRLGKYLERVKFIKILFTLEHMVFKKKQEFMSYMKQSLSLINVVMPILKKLIICLQIQR